jgi:hypothetical protein
VWRCGDGFVPPARHRHVQPGVRPPGQRRFFRIDSRRRPRGRDRHPGTHSAAAGNSWSRWPRLAAPRQSTVGVPALACLSARGPAAGKSRHVPPGAGRHLAAPAGARDSIRTWSDGRDSIRDSRKLRWRSPEIPITCRPLRGGRQSLDPDPSTGVTSPGKCGNRSLPYRVSDGCPRTSRSSGFVERIGARAKFMSLE